MNALQELIANLNLIHADFRVLSSIPKDLTTVTSGDDTWWFTYRGEPLPEDRNPLLQ